MAVADPLRSPPACSLAWNPSASRTGKDAGIALHETSSSIDFWSPGGEGRKEAKDVTRGAFPYEPKLQSPDMAPMNFRLVLVVVVDLFFKKFFFFRVVLCL